MVKNSNPAERIPENAAARFPQTDLKTGFSHQTFLQALHPEDLFSRRPTDYISVGRSTFIHERAQVVHQQRWEAHSSICETKVPN
jgi:hypothetical protein